MTRPARSDDVGALETIAHAAYERYVARIGRPPAPMEADYAAVVADGTAWVIEDDDGGVLGFVVLLDRGDHLQLDNVAVAPRAQGRGVGARLLRLAEDHARGLGRTEVRLYTNEAMTENLTYYPRHGYRETHRAVQDGYRRVFFVKELGQPRGRPRTT